MTSQYEKHRQRCEQESTRDVIFLFQRRRLQWTGNLPSSMECDDECHVWKRGADRDTAAPVTLDRLLHDYGSEYVTEFWDTEGVWLDRKEATDWGEAHAYRFSDGWRVYGMPAYGELATMLRGEAVPA